MDINYIFSIVAIHLLALIMPGPDFLIVVRTSLAFGFKASTLTSVGVGFGIVVWVFLAAFGLKGLFENFLALQILVMLFSGLYLLYISYTLFKSAQKREKLELDLNLSKFKNTHFFISGFLTNLANPKAILYFSSIFALLIQKNSNINEILLLVSIITLESMLFFILLGRLFAIKKARDIFLNHQNALDRLCCVIFALFGAFIIYETIFKVALNV